VQGSEISSKVAAAQADLESSSTLALGETSKLQEGIATSTESASGITEKSSDCTLQLEGTSEQLSGATSAAMENAEQWNAECQSVVESRQTAVAAMIAPRCELLNNMDGQQEKIETCMDASRTEVRAKMSAMTSTIEEAATKQAAQAEAHGSSHENLCATLLKEAEHACEATKAAAEKGEEQLTTMHASTDAAVSQLREQVSLEHDRHGSGVGTVQSTLQTYAEDVVHYQEPVAPVAPRMQNPYSEELSQTPDEAELLNQFATAEVIMADVEDHLESAEPCEPIDEPEEEVPEDAGEALTQSTLIQPLKTSSSKLKVLGHSKMKAPSSKTRQTTVA